MKNCASRLKKHRYGLEYPGKAGKDVHYDECGGGILFCRGEKKRSLSRDSMDKTKEKAVWIVLADGFEETEAIVPADVLRRLKIPVILTGLEKEEVRGSHGIVVKADCLLRETSLDDCIAIVLPGGLPGAIHLRDSAVLAERLAKASESGKIVAAICAAPIALERAGLTSGGSRRITGYPGSETMAPGLAYTGKNTERDGNLVTGKAPGAAFAFAAEIAVALGKSRSEVEDLYREMFVLQ